MSWSDCASGVKELKIEEDCTVTPGCTYVLVLSGTVTTADNVSEKISAQSSSKTF